MAWRRGRPHRGFAAIRSWAFSWGNGWIGARGVRAARVELLTPWICLYGVGSGPPRNSPRVISGASCRAGGECVVFDVVFSGRDYERLRAWFAAGRRLAGCEDGGGGECGADRSAGCRFPRGASWFACVSSDRERYLSTTLIYPLRPVIHFFP